MYLGFPYTLPPLLKGNRRSVWSLGRNAETIDDFICASNPSGRLKLTKRLIWISIDMKSDEESTPPGCIPAM